MRTLKLYVLFSMTIFFLISCEKKLTEEEYLKSATTAYGEDKFEVAEKNFKKLLEYYPQSKNAAQADFMLAIIYDNDLNKREQAKNIFDGFDAKYKGGDLQGKLYKMAKDSYAATKFDKALNVFKRLIEYFPEGKNAAEASFMLGFINANDIKNLDEAKKYYQAFIDKYPDSDLVDDAKFELMTLGKDINELPIFKNIKTEETKKQ